MWSNAILFAGWPERVGSKFEHSYQCDGLPFGATLLWMGSNTLWGLGNFWKGISSLQSCLKNLRSHVSKKLHVFRLRIYLLGVWSKAGKCLTRKWLDQVTWPVDLGMGLYDTKFYKKFWLCQHIFNAFLKVRSSYFWLVDSFWKFLCLA